MDAFTRQYLETALWASLEGLDESGSDDTAMDANHSLEDISEETVAQAVADCARFQGENEADLSDIEDGQAGHDFWLTRNHHGAGFWDRGHPETLGERLTDACHAFGEVNLYIGDDGKIYA